MRVMLLCLFWYQLSLAAVGNVTVLTMQGAIGPASSSYLKSGLAAAQAHHALAVVIELDTPGGLLTSMREMIQAILASPVPVIVFVSPKGAHAASAGTFLVYAAHVAAMAPGTNLGAATPIRLGGSAERDGPANAAPAEHKALNDAKAYIRSLAELHDRNMTWGLRAVEQAESLSAVEALRLGVIDLIAEDSEELLKKLDGRRIKLAEGNITLRTADAGVRKYDPDWKVQLLGIITDPNIAFILILLALYGIFFELINPGGYFPGIIGIISGVLALYALNLLPFNIAGLLLILLGIAFMVAELFISGFGILGLGGIAAFSLGALLLFDAETLGTDISLPLIIAFALVTMLFFMLVIRMLLASRARRMVSGIDGMIGSDAEVIGVAPGGYRVRCHGEIWLAVCDTPLDVGRHARVTSLSGLTLHLLPYKE